MAEDRNCPICGNEMWNNVGKKTNPKAPDYKCKDKSCTGVFWPPKDKPAPRRQGLLVGAVATPTLQTTPAFSVEDYIRVFRKVGQYFEALHVKGNDKWLNGYTVADVQAATATIVIQMQKLGIPFPPAKAKAETTRNAPYEQAYVEEEVPEWQRDEVDPKLGF